MPAALHVQRMHKHTINLREQALRNRASIRLLPALKQRRSNTWNRVRPLQKTMQHCQQHHPQQPRLDKAKPGPKQAISSSNERNCVQHTPQT